MRHDTRTLISSVKAIADVLGVEQADYCFGGRFRFDLGGRWSLVVSLDSMDRLRYDAYLSVRRIGSMWSAVGDRPRLEAIARGVAAEVDQLIGA